MSVIGGLAGTREVEHNTLLVSPEIQIARDKLRPLIDTDCLRVSEFLADLLERLNHILAPVAEAWIHGWRVARECINDGQDTDLAASCQLVMDEVHGPDLVGFCGWRAVIAQLCPDATLRHLVPQLQAHLLAKSVDSLGIHVPALPSQQDVDPPITIADTGLANLPDPELEISLLAALRLVVVERSFNPQGIARLAD